MTLIIKNKYFTGKSIISRLITLHEDYDHNMYVNIWLAVHFNKLIELFKVNYEYY